MRIVVCGKPVPDTSARLRARPPSIEPHCPGVGLVLNPYDEFALEEALRIRDAAGGGEVVLLTLARPDAEDAVFHALAMGADRCVRLEPDAGAGALDPLTAAGLLDPVIRAENPDMAFCGERAADDDAAQTAAILAERLGWPLIGSVERLEWEGDGRVTARRRLGDAAEIVETRAPCVASFVRGARLPRYPSLDDIFNAGSKPVSVRFVRAVPSGAASRRLSLTAPEESRKGERIEGETSEEKVARLLDRIVRETQAL